MQVFFGLIVYLLISKGIAFNVNGTKNRIYKGVNASDGQFPFMVAILSGLYQTYNKPFQTCTGSLIKFDTVLTACHCLHNPVPYYEYKPGNVVVMVGKADVLQYFIFREQNPITVKYKTTPETLQESIASHLFRHPKYKKDILYDVGIIKIAKPFVKTTYVNTIAYTTDEYPGKISCYFLGFGLNHLGSVGQLSFFTTNKIKGNIKDCGPPNDSPIVYCIRKDRPSEPSGCKGDSGGPLVCGHKVYGIYSLDHYYPEEPDEDYCGLTVINVFIKMSASEAKQKFVKTHAEEFASSSTNPALPSKAVQPYCSGYLFILLFCIKFNVLFLYND